MIHVRPATGEDCALLWGWANDPASRASAFASLPIPWDEHKRWYAARLVSPDSAIYIVSDDTGTAIGQVRFDIDESGVARVDLSIASEQRGRGLAVAALSAAARVFTRRHRVSIEALVKPENEASLKTFSRAGFRHDGIVRVGSVDAIRMTLAVDGATL